MPVTAINSAKSSSRPTIRISVQKIFPNVGNALKLSASHKPGKFPTVDRQAIDIDTVSEKLKSAKLNAAVPSLYDFAEVGDFGKQVVNRLE